MRLIDADAQYDRLANELTWLMQYGYGDDVYLAVAEAIRKEPTAYDINNVIEEIEKANQGCCKYCGCDLYSDDVIGIIKQGGISDEVCEWENDGDNLITSCGDYFNLYDNCTGKFKYCPVCGKKIKVVE